VSQTGRKSLQWLALALTRSTRARRLVEHFGGVQNVLKASLTELEATGIQPSPHQSLGTGELMELAHDETRSARRCFRRLSG
jgi:hypothetical protein